MDYSRIYESIITRAKNRVLTGYYEKHHIVPKCIGGTNDKSNIVSLTPREHFLCHWLLHEMHPENSKLFYAFSMMSIITKKSDKRYKPSSRVYEYCVMKIRQRKLTEEQRLKLSIARKGRKLSDEHRDKISKAKLGKPSPHKGKQLTDEHRKKITDSRLGEKNWRWGKKHTEETKEKMRKPKSLEGRMAIKHAINSREKQTCPHCGKVGNNGAMKRWHFNHCKKILQIQ